MTSTEREPIRPANEPSAPITEFPPHPPHPADKAALPAPGLSPELDVIPGPIRAQPIWLALINAVVPVVLASLIGSAVTVPQIPGWYASLAKPPFNPPNWLFAPVWTTLFALMAYAVFRLLSNSMPKYHGPRALAAYNAQLLLNILWSCAFFGLNSPLAGLAVIVPLLALIIVTIRRFAVLDPVASWLLWPYAAWVAFAMALNASIWWLNR